MLDPIKEVNDDKYLNNVAIKCRYNLLEMDQTNKKLGYDLGSHWNPSTSYPVVDTDIKDYNSRLENKSVKAVNKRNQGLFEHMKTVGIMEKIQEMDHTHEFENLLAKIKHTATCHFHNTDCRGTQNMRYNISHGKSKEKQDINESIRKKVQFLKKVGLLPNKNYKNQSFSFSTKPAQSRKKIVYDIQPITMKHEKKNNIIFPDIDRTTASGSTFRRYIQINTETTNGNDSGSEQNQRTITRITEGDGGITKNVFKLAERKKGERAKIRLNFLADDLVPEEEETKSKIEIDTKQSIKPKRTLYTTNIFVKGNSKPRLIKKKVKPIHRFVNTDYYFGFVENPPAFPKRYYNLNYHYSRNERNVAESNEKMGQLEKDMNGQFDAMRTMIDEGFNHAMSTNSHIL